jgi:hypothetical protein
MRKVASFCRWSLFMGVACGLAMLPVGNRVARAESISILILANGTPINVDAITTGGTSTDYGTVDTVTLNTLLVSAGSAYQFSALGGSSNWSGASSGGILTLSGGIFLPAGATGSTSLSVTETENGFNTPTGPKGTLFSASTANFDDAGPGNFQTVFSKFNAIRTSTYLVASTALGPDAEGASASRAIPSFATPYTLVNSISFSLSLSSPEASNEFGVTSKAVVVPEPASVVTMLIGLPLPLVGLTWLRRRRKLVQSS